MSFTNLAVVINLLFLLVLFGGVGAFFLYLDDRRKEISVNIFRVLAAVCFAIVALLISSILIYSFLSFMWAIMPT
jgi:hypothetical protein